MYKTEEVLIINGNVDIPTICMDTAKSVYAATEITKDFDVAKFNGLLFAVVTYLDDHNIPYNDKGLPWAEVVTNN